MPRARSAFTRAFSVALALLCLAVGLPGAAQLGQGQGPQLKLVTPRIDQPLADPIVIQALARPMPGRGIVSVQAFLDDEELGLRTRAPYRWVVPLPEDVAAVYIRLVAVDNSGAQTQIEQLVTFQ